MVDSLATNVVAALVFAVLGILVFFGAFALFDLVLDELFDDFEGVYV